MFNKKLIKTVQKLEERVTELENVIEIQDKEKIRGQISKLLNDLGLHLIVSTGINYIQVEIVASNKRTIKSFSKYLNPFRNVTKEWFICFSKSELSSILNYLEKDIQDIIKIYEDIKSNTPKPITIKKDTKMKPKSKKK